ncbi:MAG: DeoR/GlpR transcriptional regulator [Clostridia bacterium]|nr:DeoR/GlpR transcriptional regulator [Clostridia bacterium]MBQ3554536.1 DeoR/GlpR transcriptional regulator [Clostridia bacterium]
MGNDQRKQEILELLKKNGLVKVNELSEKFGISEVTVRNDLTDMERKGLLSRVHGGAISSYKPYYSMNMTQRLETNQSEKVDIATKVASMIAPNDTIMLNSGTTTLLTFRQIPAEYNLNIVTNSIAIALEASSNPNFNVVLIGGALNTKYQFSYGADAVSQLRNYHADKFILSVDGIDIANGFTTYYDTEAEVDRVMIEQAEHCIVVADYSKFNHSAFVKISDLSVADCIVTNQNIEEDILLAFRELGTEIYVK